MMMLKDCKQLIYLDLLSYDYDGHVMSYSYLRAHITKFPFLTTLITPEKCFTIDADRVDNNRTPWPPRLEYLCFAGEFPDEVALFSIGWPETMKYLRLGPCRKRASFSRFDHFILFMLQPVNYFRNMRLEYLDLADCELLPDHIGLLTSLVPFLKVLRIPAHQSFAFLNLVHSRSSYTRDNVPMEALELSLERSIRDLRLKDIKSVRESRVLAIHTRRFVPHVVKAAIWTWFRKKIPITVDYGQSVNRNKPFARQQWRML